MYFYVICSDLKALFPLVYLVVSKSCNQSELDQSCDNSQKSLRKTGSNKAGSNAQYLKCIKFFLTNVSLKLIIQIPTMPRILDARLVFEVLMISSKYRLNRNILIMILFFLFFSVLLCVKVSQVVKKINPSKF